MAYAKRAIRFNPGRDGKGHAMSKRSRSNTLSARLSTIVRESRLDDVAVLHIEGSLQTPIGGELRHQVQRLLRRGERRIVVSLARVAAIDAAGMGELVSVYNAARAAGAVLHIRHATANVRALLQYVGLFDLLAEPSDFDIEAAS
jgi:anti-anti-sigma factor